MIQEQWPDDCEMRATPHGTWVLHPALRREYQLFFDSFPDKETRGEFENQKDAREAAHRVRTTWKSRVYAMHYERNRRRRFHAANIAAETGLDEWCNDVQERAELRTQAEMRRQRKRKAAIAITQAPYARQGGRPRGLKTISDTWLREAYDKLPADARCSNTKAAAAIRASLTPEVRRLPGTKESSLRQRLGRLIR